MKRVYSNADVAKKLLDNAWVRTNNSGTRRNKQRLVLRPIGAIDQFGPAGVNVAHPNDQAIEIAVELLALAREFRRN